MHWERTGGMVWDGIQDPCGCRAFVHAHFHTKPGRHLAWQRCDPTKTIPFWERILQDSEKAREEAEAKEQEAEQEAMDEVHQSEEVYNDNVEECDRFLATAKKALEVLAAAEVEEENFGDKETASRKAARSRT
eukprot:14655326-Heterocapsa_arctica.AAC.1